ncbi:hypothetical protein [Microbacterium sp. A93]|uniref:hypothetical protein n=1 Tax=Microbacterium sp. A93 TaxID=3450716 RepID=UPI003F423BD5
MESMNELAVVEHGDVWLISGELAAVESVVDHVAGSTEILGGALSANAARRVSEACGVTAQVQEQSGRWVRMTEESAARLKALQATNQPRNGLMSGVIRGEKGRIDKHLKFSMPKGRMTNPLVLANVATLAASFAAQAAAEEMKETLQGIENKIDALAADRRSEMVGATRGVTSVIFESFTLYQRVGEIGSSSWDKVQSLQPEVLSTWHHGIDRIRQEASRAAEARITDRDEIVQSMAKELMPLWLPVLAQCMVNLSRFRVLEQARVESVDPDQAEEHRQLVVERSHQMSEELQKALEEVLSHILTAVDVPDRIRVAHPMQIATLHDAASTVQTQIREFGSQVNWFEDQLESWENKGWTASLRDLAVSGSDAIKGAAVKSAGAVRGVQLPTETVRGAAARSLESVRNLKRPNLPFKGGDRFRRKGLGPGKSDTVDATEVDQADAETGS